MQHDPARVSEAPSRLCVSPYLFGLLAGYVLARYAAAEGELADRMARSTATVSRGA